MSALDHFAAVRAELAAFNVAAVGSILDVTTSPRDLDLVLTSRHPVAPAAQSIEDALITLRAFGLYELHLWVDPTFRTIDESEMQRRALIDAEFDSLKLEGPCWLNARWLGGEVERRTLRREGRYLVRITRPLSQAGYFLKLPADPLVASRRYLRPALSCEEAAQRLG